MSTIPHHNNAQRHCQHSALPSTDTSLISETPEAKSQAICSGGFDVLSKMVDELEKL